MRRGDWRRDRSPTPSGRAWLAIAPFRVCSEDLFFCVSVQFGTFFACPPGMTQSLGTDCSAPGISACPLRGSRPTYGKAGCTSPAWWA
eukprot:5088253-Prymnesium_polylepis.1